MSVVPSLFIRSVLASLALAAFAITSNQGICQTPSNVAKATLNGLELVFDRQTGSIVEMSYPGVGRMLETSPERASLVDLAFPVAEFEPLRLASRYSTDAKIDIQPQSVSVTWERMGPSREIDYKGKVSVTVKFVADADGKSIVMTCAVDNQSDHSICQVLFPDFLGLIPFAGEAGTEFRMTGSTQKPFLKLKRPDRADANFYPRKNCFADYTSGHALTEMSSRWMDYGGLGGGFSLFQKRWGREPLEQVRLFLSEIDNKLRISCMQIVNLESGRKWQSGEYVLTPHKYGWAEGIEPFRAWVGQHLTRLYPVPKHVREGLGFRTSWGSEQYGMNPASKSGITKFNDLPKIAQEAKEHGLNEIVFWHWNFNMQAPFHPPFPTVGTKEEMKRAYLDCRALGVNVAFFITCIIVAEPTASKLDLTVLPPSQSYTYHTDFIPQFSPYYGQARRCVLADQSDPRWQKAVLDSFDDLINKQGIPSFMWDGFLGKPEKTPNLYTLTTQVRKWAKAVDPESTFCGESCNDPEADAIYLDYTWNWENYGADRRAFTSVFATPRLNCGVDHSVVDVKYIFMDNRYINVMPSKPDGVNGSGMIEDFPEFSRTLKQCAKLRKQFLPYFVDGKLIGDCILAKPCPGTHVSAYLLPGKALVIVLNEKRRRPINLTCELGHWVKSPSGQYEVTVYDINGKKVQTQTVACQGVWEFTTPAVEKYDMLMYVCRSK